MERKYGWDIWGRSRDIKILNNDRVTNVLFTKSTLGEFSRVNENVLKFKHYRDLDEQEPQSFARKDQ